MRAFYALALVSTGIAALCAAVPSHAQDSEPGQGGGYYELEDYNYFPADTVDSGNSPAVRSSAPSPTPSPSPAPTLAPAPFAAPAAAGGGPVTPAPYVPGGALAFPQGDIGGAKADGKAFVTDKRSANEQITTTTTLSGTVPGYTGAVLPEEALVNDPDALTSQGTSAALASDPWRMVTNPGRTVVTLDPNDLLRAKAVETDPEAFLASEADGF